MKLKKLNKGTIIRIEGHKGEWVVIEVGNKELFYAIPCAAADVITGAIDDKKVKTFVYRTTGLPNDVLLQVGDVTEIGKAKIKRVEKIEWFVTKVDSAKK